MKKEDFEYGNLNIGIEGKYIYTGENCIIIINTEIFDEETIEYVSKLEEKYLKVQDKILDFMLDKGVRDFYNNIYGYSDEYIKDNIGKSYICIDSKKDEEHPNWNFNFAGVIKFCENKLDEHLISIEFMDDLEMCDYVQIDG
ncbi:MAG: hypothetical protein E7313_01990 [Clostridiales bacterium]|nr:hypothetical protein [Clostridiales bacterium]